MNKYIIRDREAGNVIDEFPTAEKALKALAKFEKQDKANGEFTENFYEVVPVINDRRFLQRKRSGNYVINWYEHGSQELIGIAETPRELLKLVRALKPGTPVITAEYSRSHNYAWSNRFDMRQALKSFGMSATKYDVVVNF